MLTEKPKTKILVDGGDPKETLRIKSLIGFVDGQTTNPSLIAKNPQIQSRIGSGHKLSLEEQRQEYKTIVQQISPLVGDAGVSIEVFAALNTAAEQMLTQGVDMFSWIPNAYVKYPCTHEGSTSSPDVGRTRHTGQYHVVFLPGAGRRHICGHTGAPKYRYMSPHLLADLMIAARTVWI